MEHKSIKIICDICYRIWDLNFRYEYLGFSLSLARSRKEYFEVESWMKRFRPTPPRLFRTHSNHTKHIEKKYAKYNLNKNRMKR